jgi:predicted nucleic acid-binding protein
MASARRAEFFLDSNFAIALINAKDQHHAAATSLARRLVGKAKLLTSEAVVFEIANALSKPRFRKNTADFLRDLLLGEDTEVIHVSPALFRAAFHLYSEREDKGWSLTDCLSFVLMHEHGLSAALTNDEHFEQAGFKALLRD